MLPVAVGITAGQRVWHAHSKAREGVNTPPGHAHAAVVCRDEAAAGTAGAKAHAALRLQTVTRGSNARKSGSGKTQSTENARGNTLLWQLAAASWQLRPHRYG
jgi:hypothetical protein